MAGRKGSFRGKGRSSSHVFHEETGRPPGQSIGPEVVAAFEASKTKEPLWIQVRANSSEAAFYEDLIHELQHYSDLLDHPSWFRQPGEWFAAEYKFRAEYSACRTGAGPLRALWQTPRLLTAAEKARVLLKTAIGTAAAGAAYGVYKWRK